MIQYENLLKIDAGQVSYIPFHVSENLRLLYVLRGSVSCRWVAGVHTLSAGQIEIVNMEEPFCIEKCSEDNLILCYEIEREKAVEYCDRIEIGMYNCNTTLFYDSTTGSKEQAMLKDKLQMLYDFCLAQRDRAIIEQLVCDIVNFIVDNCHDLLNMLNVKQGTDPRADRFLRICTYMYSHCDEKINLKQLADGEYVSHQYLSKEFNERLNMNFKDTLEYYRIIQSVRYLIQGRKNITLISELCGFSAPRYFYKHFAMYLKCTPAEFRNQYLSQSAQLRKIDVKDTSIQERLKYFQTIRTQKDGTEAHEIPFLVIERQHQQFNKRKVSQTLVSSLMEFVKQRLPEGVEVIRISSSAMRNQITALLRQSDPLQEDGNAPPVMLIFYTEVQRIEAGRTDLAKKTGETGISAHMMCQLAETSGLCCQLDFSILSFKEDASRILGMDHRFQPLLTVMIGYKI